jgi:hypothetical protein
MIFARRSVDERAIAAKILLLKFLSKKFHRIDLRFAYTFDIDVHCDADIAVTQNCLDVFVRRAQLMQVCRKTATECMPAMPSR